MQNNFKSVNTKLVITQLYKSRNIMTIAMLRNTKLSNVDAIEEYCVALTKLVNSIAKNYNNLEEIPSSKYVEPSIHLDDISYYIDSQRKVFKSKTEQSTIDKIILLIKKTKKNLVYIED